MKESFEEDTALNIDFLRGYLNAFKNKLGEGAFLWAEAVRRGTAC